MSSGGISLRNEQEKQKFYKQEKQAQELIDKFYLSRGHEIETRKGNKHRDLVLLRGGQQRERIEEKFRFNSFGRDLLVEVMQDLVSGDVGWFSETRCDYLHYVLCDNQNVPYRLYRIKWRDGFPNWYCQYLMENKKAEAIISKRGWGLTVNLSCNWNEIPQELWSKVEILPEVFDSNDEEF